METRQYNKDSAAIGFRTPNCIVVIGTSVGGPQALESILGELPVDFPGIVLIVANTGKGFTRVLADKLNSVSHMPVSEAQDGQILRSSRVLLIPTEFTATIKKDMEDLGTHVIDLRPLDTSPKAAQRLDSLMSSAAAVFEDRTMGVILTGVGNDGVLGTNSIKAAGGLVLAQNEASSICSEAPGAAAATGLVDQIAPLWQLATHICIHATGESHENAA